LDPAITKGRWTAEEDSKLLAVIRKYGSRNWVQVAREMKNRTDVQCRHRYLQLVKAHLEMPERRVPLPPIKDLISQLLPREASQPIAAGIARWVS
jgi:myb-related protein